MLLLCKHLINIKQISCSLLIINNKPHLNSFKEMAGAACLELQLNY